MSRIAIPPALDRHLVSTAHAAATVGGSTVGAFEAAVDEVTRALRAQGASAPVVERAFRDVFAGLAFAYERTPTAARYAALEARAVALVAARAERQA